MAAATASPTIPTGDNLSNDTRTAILGDTTEGYGYVGVWAPDAAGCAVIDQPGVGDFAVITRATFRDGPKAYFGNFGPMDGGKISLTVRAAAGTRTIALEQSAPDTLTIDGKAMIRCVQ